MKTPNQIIFERDVDRNTESQMILIDVLREEIKKPEYLDLFQACQGLIGKATPNKQYTRVRNLGITGATELVGILGIWLTQFTEEQTEALVKRNRARKQHL